MSNDTIHPAQVSATIFAGATFRKGWRRSIRPAGGLEVPDDYSGCTAIAELRDGDSGALLHTFSSATGGIDLTSTPGRLALYMSAADTAALPAFTSAVCHVELRRPWGDIERIYEIAFSHSPQKTAAEPPTP